MSLDGCFSPSQTHQEVWFGLDEIFYSRTDHRGVIRAGNAVFQRVSGFDWPNLVSAPHKIIRHPDMPKAVFWLLWDRIKAGSTIGAYVKNRAEDGRYYWVFAAVMPLEDGYLSVRIKPTSDLFPIIEAEYEALRQREINESLSPEESSGLLLARLSELGFASYPDFMSRALGRELSARAASNSALAHEGIDHLDTIRDTLRSATTEQETLLENVASMQTVTTNMRIIASRLEPAGGPVTAISESYMALSSEILTQLEALVGKERSAFDEMVEVVRGGAFQLGISYVQQELVRQYGAESNDQGPNDMATEMALLARTEQNCIAVALDGLAEAATVAGLMEIASERVRRVVLGLDTIRVMGRVECGRLSGFDSGLATTLDDLDDLHHDIRARLVSFVSLSRQITATVESCKAGISQVPDSVLSRKAPSAMAVPERVGRRDRRHS
ncbi:hypothetical protein R3X27_14920 [Tropicimonas sp. TH_r6]|uniref:PAS domain-containing protein n=1 Tax=Tropicimonas sp. TH_r6 TaxID=3082085 RepID=UPI002954A778|nr:PAS domain-containing protein [Tropicimonas sp. TH_r6]MDV7143978.1 hypothetical protein [Tropicimonas sp. TH_r6]